MPTKTKAAAAAKAAAEAPAAEQSTDEATAEQAARDLRALGAFHDRAVTALRAVLPDLPDDHPQRNNIAQLIETAEKL